MLTAYCTCLHTHSKVRVLESECEATQNTQTHRVFGERPDERLVDRVLHDLEVSRDVTLDGRRGTREAARAHEEGRELHGQTGELVGRMPAGTLVRVLRARLSNALRISLRPTRQQGETYATAITGIISYHLVPVIPVYSNHMTWDHTRIRITVYSNSNYKSKI